MTERQFYYSSRELVEKENRELSQILAEHVPDCVFAHYRRTCRGVATKKKEKEQRRHFSKLMTQKFVNQMLLTSTDRETF